MGEVERLPAGKVVVSALPLRRRQLETLARQLGPAFRLVDIRDAPERAEFVLCPPCSPQTVARLCEAFPGARVVALELQDDASGLRIDGPVGRTLSGGASGYLLASSGQAVGDFLHAALAAAETGTAAELPSPAVDDVLIEQLEALAAERARRAAVARRDLPG